MGSHFKQCFKDSTRDLTDLLRFIFVIIFQVRLTLHLIHKNTQTDHSTEVIHLMIMAKPTLHD